MNTKTSVVLSFLLIAVALGTSWGLQAKLPDRMASHWNVQDQADGFMSKRAAILIMPLVSAAMLGLLLGLPALDPLKANIAQFRREFNLFVVAIIAFMLYLHGLTLAWNLGWQTFKMSAAMLPPMGALFILIGWLLRRAKRNFFIGIRTPWTLSSDSVWERTHQVGGVLFAACGALAIVGSFFGGAAALWLFLLPMLSSAVFLVAYSYWLYRREIVA
ncbi:MAG: SdpI family protein [Anaerolineales bacterium]